MFASISVMIFILFGTKIAWPWYALIGSLITLSIAALATLIIKQPNEEIY
jgi:hypothetical protein